MIYPQEFWFVHPSRGGTVIATGVGDGGFDAAVRAAKLLANEGEVLHMRRDDMGPGVIGAPTDWLWGKP